MVEPPFSRVAIVGNGLIGGSVRLAAQRAWPDLPTVALDAGDDLAQVTGAELVMLAAPVRANVTLLDGVRPHLTAGAVVTDTGSTKRAICAAAAGAAMTFIGGHPMAGGTKAGAAHARADLFDGRPWILTPGAGVSASAATRLDAFVSGLRAVPHVMTADLHDRLVGTVSHLPQLTASALMHVVGRLAGDAGLEIAGPGLLDTTRLAASPPDIWTDIAATNDDVLREALDELIHALTAMRDTLETGEGLQAVFASASRWRAALEQAK
jgi:prephenate dehydrogenase